MSGSPMTSTDGTGSSGGDVDTNPGTDGSTGGSDGGDGSSTGSLETVTIAGFVSDFVTADPLPGIDVCVFGQEVPCTTTDAEGTYTLAGVPVTEGAIEFRGSGRFPSLLWGEDPMEDDFLDYPLLSNLAAAAMAASLSEEIEDSLGHLAIAASDQDGALLSQVSFSMTPSSGSIGYLSTTGVDPLVTETTEVGFAGWLNVDVGEVEITASHPTLTCVPGPRALVGSTPDALRIDVVAGYLGSTFPFVCT